MRKSVVVYVAASSLLLIGPAAMGAAMPQAAKSAERAEKLLTRKKLVQAVAEAEAAVAAAPRDAGYRMLLGRAYLESGRYRSAATSFGDALALDPARGAAALNLALTRIGLGEAETARTVLATHAGAIPAADRGLALALAGDPTTGVSLLEEAVRNGLADAKTRQNLALSYALAGRWAEAKLMASYDLDGPTLAQRIMEWSRFTREVQAPAQVAALLGVQPGPDAGQPERLALNMPGAPIHVAHDIPPPVAMAEAPTAQPLAPEVAAPIAEAQVLFAVAPALSFAPRSEIVQAIARPAPAQPVVARAVPPSAPRFRPASFVQEAGGRYVVQIGAFDSAAVAHDAWGRSVARIGALRGLSPSIATIVRGSATFHRLSVGGFASRASAVSLCETVRQRGGQCFVRETAGDAPLLWVGRKTGTKLAAR